MLSTNVYINKPVLDVAEMLNLGSPSREHLKNWLGKKFNLYQDYVIINDNILHYNRLPADVIDLISEYTYFIIDLSHNPLTLDEYFEREWAKLVTNNKQKIIILSPDANIIDIDPNISDIESVYYTSYFHFEYLDKRYSVYDNVPVHKFSCLNSVPRMHRIILLNELHRQSLINSIQLSFWYNKQNHSKNYLSSDGYFLADKEMYANEFSYFTKNVADKCPILLDDGAVDDIHNPNEYTADYSIDSVAYKDTALNIITETSVTQQFFTEKTFKAIYAKQFFLLVCAPNSVDRLRKFGFDVYDDVIDHSYDKEPNLVKRINMIANEIARLQNIDILGLHRELTDRRYANYFHMMSPEFRRIVEIAK